MINVTGLLPGDYVLLLVDVLDGKRESYHRKGYYEKIQSITSDGEGVIFASSGIDTHHTNVRRIDVFDELNYLKYMNKRFSDIIHVQHKTII